MSELMGQMDLNEYLPEEETAAATTEGYDAEGRLLDYVPEPQTPADLTAAERLTEGKAEAPAHRLSGAETLDLALAEGEGRQARLNTLVAEVHVIEGQVRSIALSAAIEIGKRLMEAKGLVPHGRFGEWLAANLDYSERRAQDLMRLAEQYGRGTIPESVSRLDYSKAVALLGAPEEEREALAERAVDEDMSVRALQDEIKRLKKAAEVDQLTIDELERQKAEDAQTAEQAIKRMEADVSAMRGTADAANRTAEALRQEKAAARKETDLANQKARDATERANDTQRQLTEARQKISELESRGPEVVEVIPAAVQAELEQLRSQKPRGEAELKFRMAFERLGAEFRAVEKCLAEVNAEDAARGAKFAQAVATTCRRMIEMLGVE